MRSRVASQNWPLSNSPCLSCSYATNTSTQHTRELPSANSPATSTVSSALPHPPYETLGSRSVILFLTMERDLWSRVRVSLPTNLLHQPRRLPELSLLPVEPPPTNYSNYEGTGGSSVENRSFVLSGGNELIRDDGRMKGGWSGDAGGTFSILCISILDRRGVGERGDYF